MPILGRPSDFNFEAQGISGQERVRRNLSRGQLIEIAIKNGECHLSHSGAIVVNTGHFTGGSPKDKYIADYGQPFDQEINWGKINQPISPNSVDEILHDMLVYAKGKPLFLQDLSAGNHPQYFLTLQIISELAWHSLFCKNLFLPTKNQPGELISHYIIVDLPGFFANKNIPGLNSGTFIILDFERKLILIGGTAYAGEIKKAVFSVLNRLLSELGVLPMHCSANIGKDGQTALFFGLSGTGKTTLSSDPERFLIGDDETGWADEGIFNFEGGCYAKTIGLNAKAEPLIFNASTSFGSVLENLVLDQINRSVDFNDSALSENSRAAYPLEFIPASVHSGQGGHPQNIFFLSADAFGVLPPISLLNEDQVMQYFLAGFTAKLAGTEQGLTKVPQATFSACFAVPFLPLKPLIYATLLQKKLQNYLTKVWLVNTGWIGGNYGIGERIKLTYTRALLQAALNGEFTSSEMVEEDQFHLAIPRQCPGVPDNLLNPSKIWKSLEEYNFQAKQLKEQFEQIENC
jgi:phosphoenolpyruvate carboxykinase (ATP)